MKTDRHDGRTDFLDDMAPRVPSTHGEAAPPVYSVSRITREIQHLLEGEFPEVWIEGEISNFTEAHSGHWYFTLKDEAAQMDAVFFAGARQKGRIELSGGGDTPRDGRRVQVFGSITVYAPRGRYQIVVRRMKESGIGALQEAFERLKKKLQAEGLFDPARKKPLPRLPQRVAIVTSPAGAALRDMLNVLGRRFPNLHLVIFGVRVQGAGAAAEIAEAIDGANAMRRSGERDFDVLIVARGGGSIEDLWAFNEEVVARAVARSEIPVISAVGHEVDFTICDFAADVRAPTPSAAAEILVGRRDEFDEWLRTRSRELKLRMEHAVLRIRHMLADLRGRLIRRRPDEVVQALRHSCELLRRDLVRALERASRERRQRLDECGATVRNTWIRRKDAWRAHLERLDAQFAVLGPEATLRRGFSLTLRENGGLLRTPEETRPGERLTTRLAAGSVSSVVIPPDAASRPRAARARRPAADPGQRWMEWS